MMPTPNVAAHRRNVDAVVTLAMRDLAQVWRSFTFDDAKRAEREIRAILPLIVDGYGSAVATLSADWYDELREAAKASGRFRAMPARPPEASRLESLAGYGSSALYGARPDTALALSRVAGGLQRALTDLDRDTIAGNSALDPSPVRYARHASANACAFCAMLATRGAVYASKSAAGAVVGRGTEKRGDGTWIDSRRKGVRSRGSRELGQKYHDFCRCTAVPVFAGQEYEPAPYVKDWQKAYAKASRENTTEGRFGAISTKGTLADMRELLNKK